MTTELKRFTEAYATMTVASYEPLILHWVSLLGIRFVSNSVATRYPKAKAVGFDGDRPAALALSTTIRTPLPRQLDFSADAPPSVPITINGQPVDPSQVKKL